VFFDGFADSLDDCSHQGNWNCLSMGVEEEVRFNAAGTTSSRNCM